MELVESVNDRQKGFPWMRQQTIVVIGAGGIGSWTTLLLSRIGHHIILFDMDSVEPHNIGGQLFSMTDIGLLKTEATRSRVASYCANPMIDTYAQYDERSFTSRIVILAVDNMAVRKIAVEKWLRYQTENPDKHQVNILIDGRLEGEQGIIYALDSKKDADRWMKEWFPDEKIDDGPCTMRATSYNGAMIAANIVAILNNKVANKITGDDIREVPYKVEYGFPGLVYDTIQ